MKPHIKDYIPLAGIACIIMVMIFLLPLISCEKISGQFYQNEEAPKFENIPKTVWDKIERIYYTDRLYVYKIESKDGLECIIVPSGYSNIITCNWELYNYVDGKIPR